MRLAWQARSNPVARWWLFLTFVSCTNIAFWFILYRELRITAPRGVERASDVELMSVANQRCSHILMARSSCSVLTGFAK